MEYIIEIKTRDNEDYEVKEYFKNVYVDSFGIVRVNTTENPLNAQFFSTIEMENNNSIVKIVKNVMRNASIKVKEFKYTIE